MKKPYIFIKYNPITELEKLDAKSKLENPLEFLEYIRINGDWANDAPAFDLSPRLEFIISDDTLINRITDVLIDFGFILTIIDATEALLLGRINLSKAPEKIIEEINKFYIETFNGDDILDKINVKGFESLTEIDKYILNKKS